MKYLILIYGNAQSRQVFAGMSDEERASGYREYAALTRDLTTNGEYIVSEPLADASLTKRVTRGRDGRVTSSDGPFAEAKEILAGFYLVDCDSMETAIRYAGRVPEAAGGLVEVRPVLDLSAMMDG